MNAVFVIEPDEVDLPGLPFQNNSDSGLHIHDPEFLSHSICRTGWYNGHGNVKAKQRLGNQLDRPVSSHSNNCRWFFLLKQTSDIFVSDVFADIKKGNLKRMAAEIFLEFRT